MSPQWACSFEGCIRPRKTKGLCDAHYKQQWKGQELRPLGGVRTNGRGPLKCSFEGCEKPGPFRKGLCTGHYGQRWRGESLRPLKRRRPRGTPVPQCSFEACENPALKLGLCKTHYEQQRAGKVLTPIRARTGRYYDTRGYVCLTGCFGHPNAQKTGIIYEHVKVMSGVLGRPLLPGENVHHKNGVRDDNRPENLELWIVSQPCGQRPEDLVVWAREILERYGEMVA